MQKRHLCLEWVKRFGTSCFAVFVKNILLSRVGQSTSGKRVCSVCGGGGGGGKASLFVCVCVCVCVWCVCVEKTLLRSGVGQDFRQACV